MICKTEGCNHRTKKTPSPSNHVGQSWYDYGICSCCGIEFFPGEDYRPSQMCHKKLKEEGIVVHPLNT